MCSPQKINDFKLLSVLKNLHKVLRIYFMIFLKKDSFITMVLRNISMLVWEGKKKKKKREGPLSFAESEERDSMIG